MQDLQHGGVLAMRGTLAESNRCSPGSGTFSKWHCLIGSGGMADGAAQTIFLSALGKN